MWGYFRCAFLETKVRDSVITRGLHWFRRNLPRALLIGIPLVAVCYVLVNLAFFTALPYAAIRGPQAVALVCTAMTIILLLRQL